MQAERAIKCICLAMLLMPIAAFADDVSPQLEVFPREVVLSGPRAAANLIVTLKTAAGLSDVSSEARLTSADDKLVAMRNGRIIPVADGSTSLIVEHSGQKLTVPVKATGMSQAPPVSFQYDILAALSKHSCSSGACHGSPTGKGGFRLSLRGFDAALDSLTLIKEDLGRRTTVFSPEESLLLAKPTMRVPHGGGQKLKKTDVAYTFIRDWIAQGCRPDALGSARCTNIEVYPRERQMQFPAVKQRLVALAHFSDGSTRDVTDLSVFSSSDESIATVDAGGLVTSQERGDVAILVRYLDHVDTASFTFLRDVPGFAWNSPPAKNFIDTAAYAKLKQLQLPPAELCSDHEFIRRVYLDVLGILPERKEAEVFAADASADKRSRLVDALLEQPEYAQFWALKWADLLRVKSGRLGSAATHKLHRWLVRSVQVNRPYDQIARELLTASGSTLQNPPAGFYRAAADTNDCAETTAQLFLGIRIQCAKCHNHPFDRWSQDNYYGIGAFFARVGRTNLAGDETLVYSQKSGEVIQPRTHHAVEPWLPGVEPAKLAAASGEDRRELLARLLATKDNRLFAEVAANRIWGHLLGRGIVEPVDDFRPSNPPSNKELLFALTDEFIRTGFNQKELIRVILKTRTYQLSSRSHELSKRDSKCFSHYSPRLLSAEQLLDAISSVTGTPEAFTGLPAGTRAAQLPSPELGTHFLRVFGQPSRDTACDCERGRDPKLTQALQLISGPLIAAKLQAAGSRISRAEGRPPQETVIDLYYAALSRPPSEEESKHALAFVAESENPRAGLEDLCWALLNSREFLFQH